MIHIHRCTFLAQGNSAWENGSTISVNRVKNILAKQLEGLENLPGRIHLKKLTLDLGDFETLEFNNEFIERLERSCRELEGKFRELQRAQVDELAPEDKDHLDELIAFLYSLDLTQEVQNAISLLESTGFAPKLEDWKKFELRYEQMFGSRMETKLANPLKSMLVSSKATKEKSTPAKPFPSKEKTKSLPDFKQEHIDFLIESLDRVPMNTNWFKTLDEWFMKEFGSKMSMELHNRIRKVYDSFEFGLEDKIKGGLKRSRIGAKLDERLRLFFKTLDDSMENRGMHQWLENREVSNTDSFLSDIIASYNRYHKRPMPIQLERQLLRFGQLQNPLTWVDVNRVKRHRLMNKLNLLKELNSSKAFSKKKPKKDSFSQEEYDFLHDQLSMLQVDVAWYSTLLMNYQKRFQREMPEKLKEIFLKFSQDIFLKRLNDNSNEVGDELTSLTKIIRTIEPRSSLFAFFQNIQKEQLKTHEDFVHFYRVYFGHDLTSEHSDLLVQANTILREQQVTEVLSQRQKQFLDLFKHERKSKKNLITRGKDKQQSKFCLTPSMVEDVQLDFAWLANLDQRFQELHRRSIPRKTMRKIVRFLSEIRNDTQGAGTSFFGGTDELLLADIRKFLADLNDVKDSKDLLHILPPENGPQERLDFEELIAGFRAYYGRTISEELKVSIRGFHQNATPEYLKFATEKTRQKVKAALESHVTNDNFQDASKLEIAEYLREFLMIIGELQTTKEDVLSEFKSYLEKEKGKSISKKQKSFISHLWRDIQKQISQPTKSPNNFDDLVFELISAAGKVKQSNIKAEKGNDEVQMPKKQSSGVLHPDFVKRAIGFILDFLNRSKLSENWRKTLKDLFRTEFKSEIPIEWQAIMERYDFHSPNAKPARVETDSLKSKLIVYLTQNGEVPGAGGLLSFLSELDVIDSIEALFDRYELQHNEALPLVLKMTLRKWFLRFEAERVSLKNTNEQKGEVVHLSRIIDDYFEKTAEGKKHLLDFLHSIIETVPLDALWLATVSKKYKQEFKKGIPTQLLDQLMAFTIEFSQELSYSNQRSATSEVNDNDLIDLYDEVTIGMDSRPLLDQLKEVLTEMSLGNNPFSLVNLISRFKQKFNEEIPNGLLEKIANIFGRKAKYSWSMLPSNQRKTLVEEIKVVLNDSAKSAQSNHQEEANFKAKLTFLIHALEHTSIDVSWFAKLETAYFEKFKLEMPNELKDCLLRFAKEIAADGKIVVQEGPNLSSRKAIDHFVSLHLSQKVADNFQKLFHQAEVTEGQINMDELISKYESEFELLSAEQKEALEEFGREFFKKKTVSDGASEMDNFLTELNERSSANPESKNQKGIDQAHAKLAISFFANNDFSLNSLTRFESAFYAEFQTQMSASLTALIIKYIDQVSRLNELDYARLDPKIHTRKEAKSKSEKDAVESVEFHLSSKAFLSSKLEQLLLGWTDLNSVKSDYLEVFETEIPSEILSFWQSQLSTLDSEKSKRPSLIHELNQFLRKNGTTEQVSILSKLLSKAEEIADHNWFESILNAYQAKYNASLPLDMQQLLLRFANHRKVSRSSALSIGNEGHENLKSELNESWLNFTKDEQNETKNDSNSVTGEQLKFILSELVNSVEEIADQKWFESVLSAYKVNYNTSLPLDIQQLLLRFANHRKVSGSSVPSSENRDDENLKNQVRESWLKLTSDEQKETRNDSNSMTAEQLKFILSELENNEEEISEHLWFESILSAYKANYNAPLPLDMQQLLLRFANHKKISEIGALSTENKDDENLKNHLKKSWLKFTSDEQKETRNDFNSVTVEQLEFISTWLKKSLLTPKELEVLEMKFHKAFQELIPETWKAELVRYSDQIGAKYTLQFPENSEVDSKEFLSHSKGKHQSNLNALLTTNLEHQDFRVKLLDYIATLANFEEKNILVKLIQSLRELSESSWFQQLLGIYKTETNSNMPVSIQGGLLSFMQEHKRASAEKSIASEDEELKPVSERTDLFNEMNSQLEKVYLESLRTDDSSFSLKGFASILFETKLENSSRFKRAYKLWLGSNVPDSIIQKLESSSESKQGLKSRLLNFFKRENASELIQVLKKIGTLSQSDWVEKIDRQMELEFSRAVSAKERNLLMTFAAKDEFTVLASTEPVTNSSVDAEIVNDFVQRVTSDHALFLRLTEAYRLVNQSLEMSKNKTSLDSNERKKLQRKFQVYLDQKPSLEEIKMMIETALESSKNREVNHISRSRLRPAKPTKRKMISNKVKLIRLREELKAIKEGKKMEESPIVTNAGLVFGWVFWKSIFEGFSWLNEGKFIITENSNSAMFAANWLHYSVNEHDTVNPLILFICGVEENEFERLTEAELEEKMNGESLSNSVEGYYQLILSMWPIFQIDQLPDFIALFVDREAIMQDSPVGIKLKLVKEPIDALTNDKPLPWPISMINFSWTTQIIEVEW